MIQLELVKYLALSIVINMIVVQMVVYMLHMLIQISFFIVTLELCRLL